MYRLPSFLAAGYKPCHTPTVFQLFIRFKNISFLACMKRHRLLLVLIHTYTVVAKTTTKK